jgi:hypothetical protein
VQADLCPAAGHLSIAPRGTAGAHRRGTSRSFDFVFDVDLIIDERPRAHEANGDRIAPPRG